MSVDTGDRSLLPEWFRLRYAYAAAAVHAALAAHEPRKEALLRMAVEHTDRTLDRAAEELGALRPPERPPRRPQNAPGDAPNVTERVDLDSPAPSGKTQTVPLGGLVGRTLERFLHETVIPSTTVLRAGALLELKARGITSSGGEDPVRIVRAVKTMSYRTNYNIACFWASYARHADRLSSTDDHGDEVALGDSYRYLQLALRDAPPRLVRRLATWAAEDPSLASLRGSAQTRRRVAALLAIYSPKVEGKPTDLSVLEAIGPAGAVLLADVGLRTAQEVSTSTYAVVDALAERLGTDSGIVKAWLDAARMASLPGITATDVNALRSAKVSSIAQLAGADPKELLDALTPVADGYPGWEVPTLATVDHWVMEAGRQRKSERHDAG